MNLSPNKFKRYFYIGFAIVFFVIYCSFVSYTTLSGQNSVGYPVFNWPDEMANYFFINKFIDTSAFIQPEPLNTIAQNVFHPRSVNVFGENLVPMGFLGILIVYGFLGKIIGLYGVTLLTPFFAIMGALAFRGIIRQVFSETIANISTLLLLTLSVYWYYASLVMLPTILFIALLLVGIYFYLKQGQASTLKWQISSSILSGLFIGLALITRPIESIWVGAILLILFLVYRKKVRWYQSCLFIFALAMPLVLMFAYNQATYGKILSVGYLRFQQSDNLIEQLPSEFEIGNQSTAVAYFKAIFLPFGFHPRLIAVNFYKYFLKFLWPYVILFVIGAITLWFKYRKEGIEKKTKVFLLSSFIISAWLVIYYGSWLLADKMVLAQNTISNSYVRYWLPINIVILPIVAYCLVQIAKIEIPRKLIIALQILITSFLILFSINQVYCTPGDGFFAQDKIIARYYEQANTVKKIIPGNAILIVDRADKLFFPKYRVVVFNGDNSVFARLKNIISTFPVYYFTSATEAEIYKINTTELLKLKLELTQPQGVDAEFRLFRLKRE